MTIPTLEDIEDSKLAMDDIQSFTYLGVDSFIDAKGVIRDTVTGRIKKMGFAVPIPYVGSIVFAANDNVKTVDESGIIYAPKPSALPFTTSGTFVGDDDDRFFVVQGLTNNQIISDVSQNYDFETVALMTSSLIIFPEYKVLTTKGYTTKGDGKGTSYLVKTAAQAASDGDQIDGVDNLTLADTKVVIRHSSGGAKGGVGAVNIIGGYSGNTIAPGVNVRANTIGGGGFVGFINRIDGVETRYATIGGGYDNYINGEASTEDIDGAASTITGGAHHEIRSTHSVIGGGSFNLIGITCTYSGIFSGTQNTIADNASSAIICGGSNNTVNSVGASIVGGTNNELTGDNGVIGGGTGNTSLSGNNNTIVGGVNNTVSGGNSVVLGGTTNTATGQGSLAGGRSAVASGRGSICYSSDDTLGDQGETNSEANSALWKFRNGQIWIGDKLVTRPFSKDGGSIEVFLESTVSITASATIDFPDEIPSGALILGCQLRVNSAVSNTMDVAYNGAAVTQTIASAFAFAQNTRINTWFDINAAKNITSGGTTKVTISRNGGGSFAAGGEVYMQVRYKVFLNTIDV